MKTFVTRVWGFVKAEDGPITIVVKEVKFRINVDDHDYDTKKNHVLRFLDEGDKVKATIFFRGREMTRTGLGRQILERLIKDVEDKESWSFVHGRKAIRCTPSWRRRRATRQRRAAKSPARASSHSKGVKQA